MRLIDADALKAQAYKGGAFDYQYVVDLSDIVDAPTIDAVPVVHGRWIEDGDTQTCSHCGEEHEWGDYRASYCDACGAKMDRKEALCYEKTYKSNQRCDFVDE